MITLWTILFLPVLMVLFLVVIEGIHFWLARVELENALEAAALAAVKEWAATGGPPMAGWTDAARIVGLDYAAANTIGGLDFNGVNFGIEKNLGSFGPGNPNENATCTADGSPNPEGNLVFGAITSDAPLTFTTSAAPDCGVLPAGRPFAVRAQATIRVPAVCGGFCGVNLGPFHVSACATAMYDCTLGRPRLIRVKRQNATCAVP